MPLGTQSSIGLPLSPVTGITMGHVTAPLGIIPSQRYSLANRRKFAEIIWVELVFSLSLSRGSTPGKLVLFFFTDGYFIQFNSTLRNVACQQTMQWTQNRLCIYRNFFLLQKKKNPLNNLNSFSFLIIEPIKSNYWLPTKKVAANLIKGQFNCS